MVAWILNRDSLAAQGIVLVLAGIVVLGNLTVHLIYGWLHPRTRMRGAQGMTATGLPKAGDSVRSGGQPPAGFGPHQPTASARRVRRLRLLVIVVLAVGAPSLAPFDPVDGNAAALYSPPNWIYWLGTDGFGRDILSRLIYGARISLLVGLGASLLGVGVGASIGIIAGYRGGWTDIIAQRVMDAMLAFPMLLLGFSHGGGAGAGAHNVIIALAMPIVPRGPHRALQRARALADGFHRGGPRDRVQQRADHARHVLPNKWRRC